MAIDPAIGIITTAEEKLGENIAHATRFQTITGSADATEAKQHIYYSSLPDPQDGSAYTKEELQSYRPYAMIWTDENTGLTMVKTGEQRTWIGSGSIFAEFGYNADPTKSQAEIEREWKNILGEMLFQTTQPDPFDGIIENAGEGNFLDIRRVVVRQVNHWELEDETEQGAWSEAVIQFDWGVAE